MGTVEQQCPCCNEDMGELPGEDTPRCSNKSCKYFGATIDVIKDETGDEPQQWNDLDIEEKAQRIADVLDTTTWTNTSKLYGEIPELRASNSIDWQTLCDETSLDVDRREKTGYSESGYKQRLAEPLDTQDSQEEPVIKDSSFEDVKPAKEPVTLEYAKKRKKARHYLACFSCGSTYKTVRRAESHDNDDGNDCEGWHVRFKQMRSAYGDPLYNDKKLSCKGDTSDKGG